MSDWGDKNTSAAAATGGDQPTGAFDTASMASALPNGNGESTKANGTDAHAEPRAAQQAGWGEPDAYNYENYVGDVGGTFDGSARVYEWDGEEGDIGPEFPELELELFGPPEARELSQGIDFSK